MKKVIEQVGDIPEISIRFRSDLKYKCFQLTQDWKIKKHTVHVPESKAREVAISICPELGEPTIKTDNTKVILHLESELEKQNELYKGLKELGHERITKLESELKEAVELIEIYTLQNREGYHSIISNDTYSRSINFLTKYKSKE